ncbi:MAG: hypothetical protein K0R39_490 [Symbiobacteriaceae bacterium]|jgi:hypothetical protein|nr:hypothetical protein [Symbiobacteriaceae bacterium]
MGKVSKALIVLVLASLLVAVMTGPALALDNSALACWNNCGVGGGGTKLD